MPVFVLALASCSNADSAPPAEWVKCENDTDCIAHESQNCCMPWFMAVAKSSYGQFQDWFSKRQSNYDAVDCYCPFDDFKDGQQDPAFIQCREQIKSSLACENKSCVLKVPSLKNCKKNL